MKKAVISWNEAEAACRSLAKKLRKNRYDAVVCIASGGLVPGKLFSELLGIPLGIIVAKRYTFSNRARPTTYMDVAVKWCGRKVNAKKILLVDDLVDEGKTMQQIVGQLQANRSASKPLQIDIAVLFFKEKNVSVNLKPNRLFYYKKAVDWIAFPWEIQP